ncbi:PTS sugar transporter subunit IIA [Daeguia caeni]|uniref:PTS sugar transporter subunit IIA n=1 Tax=Daeguia caeni TaxID=439612 RepID=A0ABV9H397_9HYPH
MNLSSAIAPEDVILDLSISTKAVLIKKLAAHAAARTGLTEESILTALLGRERLGSTGIGHGVAMPHAPVPGLETSFAALMVLKKPIDFEAVDDLPVDVVFLLLSSPESSNEYLKILAAVARRMRDEQVMKILRGAKSEHAAYSILVEQPG